MRRLRSTSADEAAGFAVFWALVLVALSIVMATTTIADVAFAGWLVLGPVCVATGAGAELERSVRAALAPPRVQRGLRRGAVRWS